MSMWVTSTLAELVIQREKHVLHKTCTSQKSVRPLESWNLMKETWFRAFPANTSPISRSFKRFWADKFHKNKNDICPFSLSKATTKAPKRGTIILTQVSILSLKILTFSKPKNFPLKPSSCPCKLWRDASKPYFANWRWLKAPHYSQFINDGDM